MELVLLRRQRLELQISLCSLRKEEQLRLVVKLRHHSLLPILKHLNTMAMTLFAGVWEKRFHWTCHNFLCWILLLSFFTSIQLGNKWSMAHFERRGSSLGCLHRILLLLGVLFCRRYHTKHHFPLPPSAELTQNITEGLCEWLEWQRLGTIGRSPLWLWQWSPIYGRSGCRVCSSRCCSGWFKRFY